MIRKSLSSLPSSSPINALADEAPGFVWRLKSESGNATDIAYSDDPFDGAKLIPVYR